MEDIDIENLNFDVYNREVYQEHNTKDVQSNNQFADLQKYKKEIDKFVENYNKSRAAKSERNEENLDRIKKRKY